MEDALSINKLPGKTVVHELKIGSERLPEHFQIDFI